MPLPQASRLPALRAQLPALPVLQGLSPLVLQAPPDVPEPRAASELRLALLPRVHVLARELFPAPQVSPPQALPRAFPEPGPHEPLPVLQASPPLAGPERLPPAAQASLLPPLLSRLLPLPRQLPSPPIPENVSAPTRHGSRQSSSSASSSP